MNAELRKEKLSEVIKTSDSCAQKGIYYQGANKTMDVYRIPTDYLIFNQYNGRIGTYVKTHEKEKGPIDAATPEGEELIDGFLWESKIDKNKITQKDIEEKGQLEYGIVTSDGVIIDGNRRCMVLKRIAKEKKEGTAYFKAIILNETLDSHRKEIMQLETTYQTGVDDKLSYNAIQKYLKCKDLQDQDFTLDEIAKMMGEKSATIEEYLEIRQLMDDYLKEYGYEGMYRILEKETVEGPFVDLRKYLETYKSGLARDIDWAPKKDDIDDLRKVYFNYIRAGFRTAHGIRDIGNSAKDKGFFTSKSLWDEFTNQHFSEVDKIRDNEKSLEKKREENPGTEVVDIILSRDEDFRKSAEKRMNRNLKYTKRKLDDKNDNDAPLELLERAKSTLNAIKTEVDSFEGKEVRNACHEIRKKAEEFIKIVDGKSKLK